MTLAMPPRDELDPERLAELRAVLTAQVREEQEEEHGKPAWRQLSADELHDRKLAERGEPEKREREELHRANRPLWVSYCRALADSFEARAREPREKARKLEKAPLEEVVT